MVSMDIFECFDIIISFSVDCFTNLLINSHLMKELSLESGTSSENSERKTEFLLSSASSALSINDLIALFERSNDKQYAVYIQKKSNKEAEPCETPNEHIAQKSQSAHSIEVKSNEHNLSGQDDKTTEMQS